jgi:hypothetical protein
VMLGDSTTGLAGLFDGNGHAITGLGDSLFSRVEVSGEIRDLALEGEADATGVALRWGFVTRENFGFVRSVRAEGTLSAPAHAGLLVGSNYGTIEHCSSSGTIVSGGNHVGGLVGVNEAGTIRRSFSTANVTALNRVGGLVGRQSEASASISECYALGRVAGNGSVGGLVGSLFNGSVENSFARSAGVSGSLAGGLVGDLAGPAITITNTYAAATSVAGTTTTGGLVGGVGTTDHTITSSYYLESVADTVGTPLSSSEFGQASSFVGWNFTSVWQLSGPYPTLRRAGGG